MVRTGLGRSLAQSNGGGSGIDSAFSRLFSPMTFAFWTDSWRLVFLSFCLHFGPDLVVLVAMRFHVFAIARCDAFCRNSL